MPFNADMNKLARENDYFQKEVYLDKNIQIVLMSIQPGEEIGMESHRADQTTFFVDGTAQAIVDGEELKMSAGHMLVIPKGAQHNIINKGKGLLKLFSVYSPAAEEHGVAHKTKADAEAAEEGFVSRVAKKAKEAIAS